GDVSALRQSYAGFLEQRPVPPLTVEAPAPVTGTVQLHPHPELSLVHLEKDGRILSAAPEGGGIGWIEGEARAWELLLPLGEQDF
ncbi:hypothetical protein, partial [Klebsiella pneumoniae]|uniref:hypothetical protein n=1 Tax=Klebsiella pneumoniae TaxID=573 RepID=UPI003CF9DEE2